MLTDEQKKKILEVLLSKTKRLTCPMCQNHDFQLSDGYFLNIMQIEFETLAIRGTAIPTIGVICKNCGFLSQHALGPLGILHNHKFDKDDSK